jgi:molybdate-binding protein/DNA-binding transcriptional regulator YhcF (GntR family)
MEDSFLYRQIAEAVRREILEGNLKPGDRLPSVRQLCEQWNCTPGTVQRAYAELARQGLVISQAGRGTQVSGAIPPARAQEQSTLRRAQLVHRSEAFLLEALTAGYDLNEIQLSVDMAMDRWRALTVQPVQTDSHVIRFTGSHDMVLNGLSRAFFGAIVPDVSMLVSFTGSLGGLMALAEGRTDIAGSHLWDAETDTYNTPFVRRLLPGKDVAILTLAHRRQGLILAPGNPLEISGLSDLLKSGVRFANRQPGSGTRVWLDDMLGKLAIDPRAITGYSQEYLTHTDVARAIAEGGADVGLGLETAALSYGLDFLFLNREQFDLVMLRETAGLPVIRQLVDWLNSVEGKNFVDSFEGYDSESTGKVTYLHP